ncbi:MAG: AtpZ/AtpI family protein [Candidatus Aminicenantes bacterium]
MPDNNPGKKHQERQKDISSRIGKKAKRKLEARKHKEEESIWFGLGMFGLVGWAVSIPTVIGIAVGVWLDSRYPGPVSWTLTFLVIGIALGCWNAWYWVSKERDRIQKKDGNDDE